MKKLLDLARAARAPARPGVARVCAGNSRRPVARDVHAVPDGRQHERDVGRSRSGSHDRRVGLRHLLEPPVRCDGTRRCPQGQVGRRRRRPVDGPRRERDVGPRERRREPGRIRVLRPAAPEPGGRPDVRRPRERDPGQHPGRPGPPRSEAPTVRTPGSTRLWA